MFAEKITNKKKKKILFQDMRSVSSTNSLVLTEITLSRYCLRTFYRVSTQILPSFSQHWSAKILQMGHLHDMTSI